MQAYGDDLLVSLRVRGERLEDELHLGRRDPPPLPQPLQLVAVVKLAQRLIPLGLAPGLTKAHKCLKSVNKLRSQPAMSRKRPSLTSC